MHQFSMEAPDLASLLVGLDDRQIEAVALACASEYEGAVAAYERAAGWTAALHHPPTKATVVVDGFPSRREALEALILKYEAGPNPQRGGPAA